VSQVPSGAIDIGLLKTLFVDLMMKVLDTINYRWGSGTLRSAGVPINLDWVMRREMMSPSYTTKLDQLWKVACK